MLASHDIECVTCAHREENALVDVDHMPKCAKCGGVTETSYTGWSDAPMIGTWKAHAQEVWNEIDPGNTKKRMKGNAMVTVSDNISGTA